MLSRVASSASRTFAKVSFAQQQRGYKVCVLGMAGGIGQPLSLLLKLNPRVTALTGYDVAPFTPGVGVDLAHCSSNSTCVGYTGDDMKKALDGSDVVVIPAGVPRKPGMTRDDLFAVNAGIVKNLITGVAEACPNACILIISNPVNSTVPIAAAILKAKGVYNPKKLMGVTTLDVCRARTFVANAKGLDINLTNVPVVGGHAGTTIVPLLSQAEPTVTFTDEERDALSHRIAFGGDEVVKAKAGAGSATLSMGYTGAHFADRVMAGLSGEKDVVECSFVESSITDAKFFASKVTLGKEGVEKVHDLGTINDYEKKLIAEMMPDLIAQADKGFNWAKDN